MEGLVTFFLSIVISLALQFCISTETFHFKGEKKTHFYTFVVNNICKHVWHHFYRKF